MNESTEKQIANLVDVESIRSKLKQAESADTQMGRVWKAVRRQATAAPDEHAWFVPFTAAMTGDEPLIDAGKRIIERYLDAAHWGPLGTGVQFHFWCFSFPHARWAIWFDVLRRLGAWSEQEAAGLAAKFLRIQLRDFHSGMLTKPHPETADNQTASLTLSSIVLGTLFADFPGEGRLAEALRSEALARSEELIGSFPSSGYSGEGSTYQGRVVAVTIPFLVEFLEANFGGDWFNRQAAPNGTSAADILRMTVRMWMPSGLLLPWDDYGYQLGVKGPVAYLLKRTREAKYATVLEQAADWSENGSAGWGYDDLVWALVHWPDDLPATEQQWEPWWHEEIGGVLVSPGGERYLMQMWDETSERPLRAQVNPNQVILEADGVPLIADGVAAEDCDAFKFDDTWVERKGMTFGTRKSNYGKSCGGAHSVVLLDHWEGLRPNRGFAPQRGVGFDPDDQSITGDGTGIYASVWDDVRSVRRRSRLIDNRCWLVEDLVLADKAHEATSRWYFRPNATVVDGGVNVETAEGMRLQMRALVGPGAATVQRVEGFPKVLDGRSDRVDFRSEAGEQLRWLWLIWPQATRQVAATLDDGWFAWPGADNAGVEQAWASPAEERHAIGPSAAPWMLADVPMTESWWYGREIDVPGNDAWWLRLPRGLPAETRVWIDDTAVDMSDAWPLATLLPVDRLRPDAVAGRERVRITLHLPFEIGHYPKRRRGKHKREGEANVPDGPVRLITPVDQPTRVESASYDAGRVAIACSDGSQLKTEHELMPADGGSEDSA